MIHPAVWPQQSDRHGPTIQPLLNPGFRFGKLAGFPHVTLPGFSKPWLQYLVVTEGREGDTRTDSIRRAIGQRRAVKKHR